MVNFPAELFLTYIGELLNINPTEPYEFNDPSILREVDEFLQHPKDEWDVSDIDPLHVWELIVQELILNNKLIHLENTADDPEVVRNFATRYWAKDFTNSFFDPTPKLEMSLIGWINYNFSISYELTNDRIPRYTLHGMWSLANKWLEASPTYDELLSEHIVAVLAEIREGQNLIGDAFSSDYESPNDWLYNGDGNDLIYESAKVMYRSMHLLIDSINLGKDTIVGDVGLVVLSELREDYVDVVNDELGFTLASYTPISMVSNMLQTVELQID